MRNRNSPLSPEIYLRDLFASKAVSQGGVIRRKARDVLAEIERRGFRVAENSGQFVLFCNRAPVRWVMPKS